jgi:hypothetical protein
MKKQVLALAAVAGLIAATLGAVAPAYADGEGDGDGDGDELVVSTMSVVGYDEAVANANGFEIVTHPDGQWESVAVTPEAQAIRAEYGGSVASRRVTVPGTCGTSWIELLPNISYVRVNTGYSVAAPVANRISWVVQAASIGGLPTVSWPSGPSPATWQGIGSFSTGGIGGWAWVTSSSSVLLIDGRICSSGGPAQAY